MVQVGKPRCQPGPLVRRVMRAGKLVTVALKNPYLYKKNLECTAKHRRWEELRYRAAATRERLMIRVIRDAPKHFIGRDGRGK